MLRMLKLYDELNSFEYHAKPHIISSWIQGSLTAKLNGKILDIIYLCNEGVLMTKNIFLSIPIVLSSV